MTGSEEAGALRVGVVFEYGSLNGGEHSMLAAIEASSLTVLAFCPPDTPLADLLASRGVRVVPWTANRADPPAGMRELNALVAEHRLQLLHANSLAMGRMLSRHIDQFAVPVTAHLRDIIGLSASVIGSLNRLAGLVAVSQATRDFHVRQGLAAERVVVIHNGIDCRAWAPQPRTGSLRRELGLPESALVAACIGQICLRKGQLALAESLVRFKDRIPELHLLLIGLRHSTKQESVEYDERITRTFEQAGVAGRLHRLGFRGDILHILNEIDFLIHPARQEPFGRVLLEAAACGVPIVATRVGGTEEMFEHEVSALLVDPQSPEELDDAIATLANETQRRLELGAAARASISQRFSIERSTDSLRAFWRSIIVQG